MDVHTDIIPSIPLHCASHSNTWRERETSSFAMKGRPPLAHDNFLAIWILDFMIQENPAEMTSCTMHRSLKYNGFPCGLPNTLARTKNTHIHDT